MISINDFNKFLFWSVHDRAASLFTCVIPRVGCAQTLQSRRPPSGKDSGGWFPWWLQPRAVCLLALGYQVVFSRVVPGKGPRSSERPRSKHRHEEPWVAGCAQRALMAGLLAKPALAFPRK